MPALSINPDENPFAVLSSSIPRSSRCLFIASKEWECCLICRAVNCLSSDAALWVLFWQHFLGCRCSLVQEDGVECTGNVVVVKGWLGMGLPVPSQVGWAKPRQRVLGTVPAPAGSHRRSRAATLLQPRLHLCLGSINIFCVPYAFFQQEIVHESATSFVTVVAVNRKWLIFHDYFSVRHDSWENASVWLAAENEPALLSFKSKCGQAPHANIPVLEENSLPVWLMLCCQCVSTKVNHLCFRNFCFTRQSCKLAVFLPLSCAPLI